MGQSVSQCFPDWNEEAAKVLESVAHHESILYINAWFLRRDVCFVEQHNEPWSMVLGHNAADDWHTKVQRVEAVVAARITVADRNKARFSCVLGIARDPPTPAADTEAIENVLKSTQVDNEPKFDIFEICVFHAFAPDAGPSAAAVNRSGRREQ